MKLISKLLRKNTSPARLAGFLISNLIGLAIIGVGLQFWLDARSIWQRKDSFLKSDYLAINKIIDTSHTLGNASVGFTPGEIADLRRQPWVARVGTFSRADFNVHASVALDAAGADGRAMSTAMFFEAVPEEFLDVADGSFTWQPGDTDLPVIISKDYLALYNFGFAGAAGLPRLSESLISGIPLRMTLSSDDGTRRVQMLGHVAGYSNRFNTILVPESFLKYMNQALGSHTGQPEQPGQPGHPGQPGQPNVSDVSDVPVKAVPTAGEASLPSRLIVDVSSPGDAAIAPYLKKHGWEVAGDKSAASATYMLRVVAGIVIAIGSVITILSIFILVLSMSLIMEKNRRRLHSLLMLGYGVGSVARPYRRLTLWIGLAAGALAMICVAATRACYLGALTALGATPHGIWPSLLLLAALTLLIILLNCVAVQKRVRSAWR